MKSPSSSLSFSSPVSAKPIPLPLSELNTALSQSSLLPPLEELSKVWGINVVNGGDCADTWNYQVIRNCDEEGFISFISLSFRSLLLLSPALSLRPLPPPSPSALSLRPLPPPSRSALSLRPLAPPSRSALSLRPLAPPSRSAPLPCATPVQPSHLPVSLSPLCQPLTSLSVTLPAPTPSTLSLLDLGLVPIGGTLPASMGNMTNLQKL
ncbi:unnamed protein product [Closterium sp. NIES-64]|nr:unnamed protein product [Closterium sp. NIES-64]